MSRPFSPGFSWLLASLNGSGPDSLSSTSPENATNDFSGYTRRQVARMVEFCNQTGDLAWMGQVITCLATSGLRINELAQLRWSDVDLDVRTIRITDERSVPRRRQTGSERRIKGKRGRALPMHAEFFKVLQQIRRHADGRIFHGPRGGRLSDRRVLENLQQRIIKPLTKEFPTPPGEIGFSRGRSTACGTFSVARRIATERVTPNCWNGSVIAIPK